MNSNVITTKQFGQFGEKRQRTHSLCQPNCFSLGINKVISSLSVAPSLCLSFSIRESDALYQPINETSMSSKMSHKINSIDWISAIKREKTCAATLITPFTLFIVWFIDMFIKSKNTQRRARTSTDVMTWLELRTGVHNTQAIEQRFFDGILIKSRSASFVLSLNIGSQLKCDCANRFMFDYILVRLTFSVCLVVSCFFFISFDVNAWFG